MSQRQCPLFCCSDFATYIDSPLRKERALTNPIHPIYSPGNFPPEVDYSVLEPSLRLASHLLGLDSATRFIHTLTHGDLYIHMAGNAMMKTNFAELDALRKEKKIIEINGLPIEQEQTFWPNISRFPSPGQREVTQSMQDEVNLLFAQAQPMLAFHFTYENKKGARTHDLSGPLPQPQATAFPRGCKCIINLSLPDYNALSTSHDAAELLSLQYFFAIYLVHELGHALSHIKDGSRNSEFFFENELVSEAGFAFEAAIFGGLLRPVGIGLLRDRQREFCSAPGLRREGEEDVWTVSGWPSGTLQALYWVKGLKLCSKVRECNGCTMVERVPRDFVESLFTDEFWEKNAVRGVGSTVSLSRSFASVAARVPSNPPSDRMTLAVPKKGKWMIFFDYQQRITRPWLSQEEARLGYRPGEPKPA